MNNLIRNIMVSISGKDITIDIEAEDEYYNATIEATLRSNNTFRFSYHHPENDKVNQYTGFVEGSKVWFYPQYGEARLTDNYIQAMKG